MLDDMNLKPPYAVYLGERGKDRSYRKKILDIYFPNWENKFNSGRNILIEETIGYCIIRSGSTMYYTPSLKDTYKNYVSHTSSFLGVPDLYVLDMSKGFSDEVITDSILDGCLFGDLG